MSIKNDRVQGILFNQSSLVSASSLRPLEPVFIWKQNDRLQGILFDKQGFVDLTDRSTVAKLSHLASRWLAFRSRS